jgi:hypothetical protein
MAQVSDNLWEDLVLSILSVNQYSLEKTYLAVEGLRREGLFEPDNLISLPANEISTRLKQGGLNRGVFMTTLFAHRLSSLGYFLQSNGLKACEATLQSNDSSAIGELLLPIKGIGPKVLQNFFILRGISVSEKATPPNEGLKTKFSRSGRPG